MTPLPPRKSSLLSPARADISRITEFHGPSSVLFDEDASNIRDIKDPNDGRRPLKPISLELMAKAATQRTCSFIVLESPLSFSITTLASLLLAWPTRAYPAVEGPYGDQSSKSRTSSVGLCTNPAREHATVANATRKSNREKVLQGNQSGFGQVSWSKSDRRVGL